MNANMRDFIKGLILGLYCGGVQAVPTIGTASPWVVQSGSTITIYRALDTTQTGTTLEVK